MTLTAVSPVNIGSSRFVRSGKMLSTGLKIRWEKSREGSSPSLGTNYSNSLQTHQGFSYLRNGLNSVESLKFLKSLSKIASPRP